MNPFLSSDTENDKTNNLKEVRTIGGDTGYISKLNALDVNDAKENGNTFSMWAGSVKYFPVLISYKVKNLIN